MYNEIIPIDDIFLEDNIIDRQMYNYEYNNVYFAYYSGHSIVTMQAVCNDICLPNVDCVKNIFDMSLSVHSPLFLMADGGSGKTTLLWQTALYAAKHNVHTFFFDTSNEIDMKSFISTLTDIVSKNVNHKVLLCIDNFSRYPELLQDIYSHVKDRRNWKKYSNFHLILSERISGIRKILSENERFPLWKREAIGFCIHNGEIKKALADELHKYFFSEKNIYNVIFPNELKRRIIQNKVKVIGQSQQLNANLVETTLVQLSYEKSIEEIATNFKSQYNQSIHNNIESDIRIQEKETVKEYQWPWNVWKEKTTYLDKKCKLPISNVYKYIAALGLFNIDATLPLLRSISGFDGIDEEKFIECFKDTVNKPVQITYVLKAGKITACVKFNHDMDAETFFGQTSSNATDILLELIENELLDSDTVISFEKNVFSLSNFFFPDLAPTGVDIKYILDSFYNSNIYKQLIIDKGRLYSLELAKLLAVHAQGIVPEKDISDSFNKTISYYDNATVIATNIWQKYISFSLTYCSQMPSALLNYLCPENYRQLSRRLDLLCDAQFVKKNSEYSQRINNYQKSFYTKIVEEIDKKDTVSILCLGNLFEEEKKFNEARKLYMPFLDKTIIQYNILTKYLASFNKEIVSRLEDDIKPDLKKIETLKQSSDHEYRKWIHYLSTIILNDINSSSDAKAAYVSIVAKFSHELKRKKQFEEAFNILQNVPDDYPHLYRIKVILAMIYQDYDPDNKYRDLQKAELYLEEALQEINNKYHSSQQNHKKTFLSILRPLMHTYIELHNVVKARYIAQQIIEIDKNDSEACSVLNGKSKKTQNPGEKRDFSNQSYTVIDGIYYIYSIANDSVTIEQVGKILDKSIVELPSQIGGKPVVAIGSGCFGEQNLVEEIILPNTIKEIRDHGFSGCRCLNKITIPDSCEHIGEYAFQWCKSLTEICIPASIKIIEEATFISCFNLINISLKEGLKQIKRAAFFNCEYLQTTIPDSIIEIENEAFYGCNRDLIKYNKEKKSEWFNQWPYNEKVIHNSLGTGIVINVIFRQKDTFDITIAFDTDIKVINFPRKFNNEMLFENDESKKRIKRMLDRIARKEKRNKNEAPGLMTDNNIYKEIPLENSHSYEIEENEKGADPMTTIFISHTGKDTTLAKSFEESLKKYNYNVIIDTTDLKSWDNLKKFMKSIRETDYVVLIVSDGFLHSPNCMYEVSELLKDDMFIDKIFPISVSTSDEKSLFNLIYKAEIIKYWENQKNLLTKKVSELNDIQSLAGIIDEYRGTIHFPENISIFLGKISNLFLPSLSSSDETLDVDHYAKEIDDKIKLKNKSTNHSQ